MSLKIEDEDQQILKNALRCYRQKELSMQNDVRDIQNLLDKIVAEIKNLDTPVKSKVEDSNLYDDLDSVEVPNPKKEYMEKITG